MTELLHTIPKSFWTLMPQLKCVNVLDNNTLNQVAFIYSGGMAQLDL